MKKLFIALAVASVSSLQAACTRAETPKEVSLDQIKTAIVGALKAAKPDLEVESVDKSPVPGLYKASVKNGSSVYATADGQYFVAGEIYQVMPGKLVNLTEQEKNGDRAKLIATVKKDETITFPAKGEVKKVMYVFTDVDCGYCQLLHSKVAEYNDLGVEVRYLAYPRAGVGSETYDKLVTAWCSDDPKDVLTKLKNREEVPNKSCDKNPVASQYELGQRMGVNGTPALVFDDGQLVGGYIDPERLKTMFNL